MTEAKYIGKISPILYDNWTDNVPSYYSYYDSHMRRKAAKKKLRRERMVFFAVLVTVVAIVLSVMAINGQSHETYEANLLHAVEYGDTLWSIANTYKGEDVSTGEFVYEIKKINSMKTSEIMPGDLLIIPE